MSRKKLKVISRTKRSGNGVWSKRTSSKRCPRACAQVKNICCGCRRSWLWATEESCANGFQRHSYRKLILFSTLNTFFSNVKRHLFSSDYVWFCFVLQATSWNKMIEVDNKHLNSQIDLDTIEVSNLNRQFLFRREHVGRPKSVVAKESALRFNPKVDITAYHDSIFEWANTIWVFFVK